jgi:hypothetical protein
MKPKRPCESAPGNALLIGNRKKSRLLPDFDKTCGCEGLQPSELFSAASQCGTDPCRGVGSESGQKSWVGDCFRAADYTPTLLMPMSPAKQHTD